MRPLDKPVPSEDVLSGDSASPAVFVQSNLPSGKLPPELQKQVDQLDARRLHLVAKKFDGGGLTPTEEKELENVQDQMFGMLDDYWPLPFERLDQLEALARSEGLLAPSSTSAMRS